MAILLGSGIKGKNVQQVSRQVIKKFGKNFLNTTVDELKKIEGIGHAKAMQIAAAVELVKRFYSDEDENKAAIKNSQDVLPFIYDLRNKKKEYLICLYLDTSNVLIKKEVISIGLVNKTLFHPREIFEPAFHLNASSIIIAHNHPTGSPNPSQQDKQIVNRIAHAGNINGIEVIDFLIITKSKHYSFFDELRTEDGNIDYVANGIQRSLFDSLEIERPAYEINADKAIETYLHIPLIKKSHFQLHNRRYIGNKHKLIEWIFSIIQKECRGRTFTDIFAGTGVVTAVASKHFDDIIVNDFLYSNQVIYNAFFGNGDWDADKIDGVIRHYNNINGEDLEDNYFSRSFGGKYFSNNSAKIIGFVRDNIEDNHANLTKREYDILIASLLYSIDKIANTVGHYDAYFKKEFVADNFFMRPIDPVVVKKIAIFRDDANLLAKRIDTDIVYIDPPYNSRQYSRFYHLLETVTKWDKPKLHGVALKPEAENMSDYCRVSAKHRFAELVHDLKAKHLVVSYNNTYDSKSSSSKNKISLTELENILSNRGKTKVFEKEYRHFNAGNTDFGNHKEYLFVTNVNHT